MINGIAISKLRHSEFSQFISDVLSLVQQNDPTALNVQSEYDTLKASHEQLVALLNPEQGSDITRQIEQADLRRDNAINGLTALIRAYTYHYDPAFKTAADQLLAAFDLYGTGIARQNYQSQTSSITSLMNDLRSGTELPEAAAALQITGWVDELENANQQFNSLYLERVKDISDNPVESVYEKRLAITEEYYSLRDMISAHFTIQKGVAPYSTVTNQINQLISSYNTLLAARQSAPDEQT